MSVPSPLHVLSVFGARPQFVKAAVVSRAIADANRRAGQVLVRETTIHTGQHWDHGMSQVFFDEMEIATPTANLGIGGGSHGAMTGRMLEALEREMLERVPDVVLVYGDTNSTLAAALAAAKLCLPVAHVEAGLRSFNRRMPEEINRTLVDHVAALLFCPAQSAADRLAVEGIRHGVHVTGDVMVDAQLFYRGRAIRPAHDEPFALATLHRAENTDDPNRLRAVIDALAASPVTVVLPVHPRTRQALERCGAVPRGSLRLAEPLSYFEMLGHLDSARFVVTDSGGLQKEAYVFGRRCLTLREETEWTELVDLGANRLVGADADAIRGGFAWADRPLDRIEPVYGDGRAGDAIVALLLAHAREPVR